MQHFKKIGIKGDGSYSRVYSAKSKEDLFAIKRNIIDSEADFFGSVRELDILARLNGHPHIVGIEAISIGNPFTETFSPVSCFTYKDDRVHFIFEEAQYDGVIFFQQATWEEKKKCMVHLLLGIEYCHAKNIIHRDLKPANLLIFKKDEIQLKICDFGLSKPYTIQGIQTPSIVTSWYRAPEILFEEEYDKKVDLWSIGCIFYEMITLLPLLNGSPDRKEKILESLSQYFPELRKKGSLPKTLISWEEKINDESFLDLLRHLLITDPKKRFSASQCLDHPFFEDHREYISKVKEDFPPLPDPEEVITFKESNMRTRAGKMARKIFNDRFEYKWYSHRILFQGLSLYDRCTYHSPNLRLTFLTCLYIAIKYFSTLSSPISFVELYGYVTEKERHEAERIEMNLIESHTYVIYQPTIYDVATEPLENEDIDQLLEIYITGQIKEESIKGLIPSQVYKKYQDIRSFTSGKEESEEHLT